MSEKQTVTARFLCDLTDELDGRFFHNLCIGAKRDVLMLSTAKRHKYKGFRLKGEPQFRVHHWHNSFTQNIDLPASPQTFYSIGSIGTNYICVVARCAPQEHNAFLFNAQGNLLHSWHIGDAVEDVQVAPNGQIWVSYFDEGALGGADNSPSREGLACFNSKGELLFGFAQDANSGSIWDCYALNVASNRDTWLCYYGGFPLVHLRDFKIKESFEPPPEMIGSHAFAVCDWRRLFVGGYHFKKQLFWRDEASKRQIEIEVLDENGDAITWKRALGRGADLFLCDDAKVHVLSLNEIGF